MCLCQVASKLGIPWLHLANLITFIRHVIKRDENEHRSVRKGNRTTFSSKVPKYIKIET